LLLCPEIMTILYQRIAGVSWWNVHEALRKAHLCIENLHARGIFRVRHGRGRIARCLAWLLRLPSPGEAVDISLTVERLKQGERWIRSFGDRQLVTYQYEIGDGLLAERFGFLEFRFQLAIKDGAIDYSQQEVGLRLGPCYLAIPGPIAPQVRAREEPVPGGDCSHVLVMVTLPLTGLLMAYEGDLKLEGMV
jgi:hypothetical protein